MRSALIVIAIGFGVAALALAANEAFAARDVQPEGFFPKSVKLACWPFGARGARVLVCREK